MILMINWCELQLSKPLGLELTSCYVFTIEEFAVLNLGFFTFKQSSNLTSRGEI